MTVYQHKRSATATTVPTAGQLLFGELAVNTADGNVFTRLQDGSVFNLTTPLPSRILQGGAVTGNVIRWNGTAWAADQLQFGDINDGGASTGDVLQFDGSIWAATYLTVSPNQITQGGASAGQVILWNGSAWTPTFLSLSIESLEQGTATEGQAVVWDDLEGMWMAKTVQPNTLGQASATTGQFLKWGGSAWQPASLPYASLTSSQSFITSDVTLTSASTWYTVSTVTLAAGTWLVLGNATMSRAGTGTRSFGIQINISTTTYASASQGLASATGNAGQLSCQAIITLTSSTAVTLQAASSTAGDYVLANEINMSVGKASGIVAVRIA